MTDKTINSNPNRYADRQAFPEPVRLSASDVVWSTHSITSSDTVRALLFESRDLLLALPADSVREVIDMPAAHPVPGSAAWFGGVAVYRGRPVPLFDVAAYVEPNSRVEEKPIDVQAYKSMDDPETHFDKEMDSGFNKARAFNRAIAVQLASSTYLIAASKIFNLCSLPSGNDFPVMQQLPRYVEHRAIKKVCRYDNRLLAVIDLPELLRCTKLLPECAFC